MNFDIVLKAATWLGKDEDKAILLKLKELCEQKEFYITVWGMFSAGKSKLLNNLLQRNLLPVKTSETTAVLTYIRYGWEEKCVIFFENEVVAEYPLEFLHQVFQNTDENIDVSAIDHIEVYLKNDLLKEGLVLVDTPGVNTVLKKHQVLAAEAMKQAGRILYVLGGTPTDQDRKFISMISSNGIGTSFVRTHCDRMNENEEDPKASLEMERASLCEYTGENNNFIALSNEKDSKWFSGVDDVKILLEQISSNLETEMLEQAQKRLEVFASSYLLELQQENMSIGQLIEGEENQVSERVNSLQSELSRLKVYSSELEQKVEKRVSSAKENAQRDIRRLLEQEIDEFSNSFDCIISSDNISDEAEQLCKTGIENSAEKINSLLNHNFEGIVSEELEYMNGSVSEAIPMGIPSYREIQAENTQVLDLYRFRLKERRDNIEGLLLQQQQNRAEMNSEFDEQELVNALNEIDEELAAIPSEVSMRLVEEQGTQPSTVLKYVGMAADMALLLLPGDVVVSGIKATVNTTKIAQGLHRAGNLGKVIANAGNIVSKNAKAIDKVRDFTYAVNTVFKKRNYSTQAEKELAEKFVDSVANKGQKAIESYKSTTKEGNVLDMLSVAYWTEKLGKEFDKPPRLEVNEEIEFAKRQKREELTSKKQNIINQQLQRKKELGLIKSKEEEINTRLAEERRMTEAIEQDMRHMQADLERKAKSQAFDHFKNQYCKYYEKCLSTVATQISTWFFENAPMNLTFYLARECKSISDRITEKEVLLKQLLEEKEHGVEELVQRQKDVQFLIGELERMG